MSEEEQLQAAIAASTADSNYNPITSTNSSTHQSPATDDQHHKMDSEGDGMEKDQEPATTTVSALDAILPVERPETTDMANSTRIQFRLADGSRVIRRFLKSDPVRYLFEFIKWKVPETKDQAFEVRKKKEEKRVSGVIDDLLSLFFFCIFICGCTSWYLIGNN